MQSLNFFLLSNTTVERNTSIDQKETWFSSHPFAFYNSSIPRCLWEQKRTKKWPYLIIIQWSSAVFVVLFYKHTKILLLFFFLFHLFLFSLYIFSADDLWSSSVYPCDIRGVNGEMRKSYTLKIIVNHQWLTNTNSPKKKSFIVEKE